MDAYNDKNKARETSVQPRSQENNNNKKVLIIGEKLDAYNDKFFLSKGTETKAPATLIFLGMVLTKASAP